MPKIIDTINQLTNNSVAPNNSDPTGLISKLNPTTTTTQATPVASTTTPSVETATSSTAPWNQPTLESTAAPTTEEMSGLPKSADVSKPMSDSSPIDSTSQPPTVATPGETNPMPVEAVVPTPAAIPAPTPTPVAADVKPEAPASVAVPAVDSALPKSQDLKDATDITKGAKEKKPGTTTLGKILLITALAIIAGVVIGGGLAFILELGK